MLDDVAFIDEQTHNTFPATEIKEDDVLLNITGASIGRSAIANSDIAKGNVNQHVCIIRPIDGLLNSRYLCDYLLSERGQKKIDSFQAGGNRQGLNFQQIKSIILPLPPLAEQQAIAKALGEMDALLAAQRARLAKQRAVKQGLLQGLLSGEKRLPGFVGKWEVKRLGDFVAIKKGRLITEKTCVPGDVPVIAGGQTAAYYHNAANRHNTTITISASGAYAGFVGFHEVPIFASDCSTIERGRGYDLRFIYAFLKSQQQVIYKAQTGGAQPHIHAKDIAPMELGVPPIEEQRAIADVLTEADAHLAALEAENAKTQLLKQGMMQNLLTGKIRLV